MTTKLSKTNSKKRLPGRPPAAGTVRQVRLTITLPPEYRAWLEARGNVSQLLRAMIEREMKS
jgi:hypothetical protein